MPSPNQENARRASPIRPPSADTERDIAMERAAQPVVPEPTTAVINANTVQTLLAVAGMIERGEWRK